MWGLVAALVAALLVQVPMFPGMGLETRDATTFAPWFQMVSLVLFPSLLVAAVIALVVASGRPRVSASLAAAFGAGMIIVTSLDLSGAGGAAPPLVISILEAAALVTLGPTLVFAGRVLATHPCEETDSPVQGALVPH